jgi:hypothetical protein
VSLRLREEQRIVLRPDRVVLAQVHSELTRHGWKRHVSMIREIPCASAAGDEFPWSGALRALETILPEFTGRESQATVVLSNHFMRYVLLPWSDALRDAQEENAYARHSFREMYGRDSNPWEIRVSPGKTGMPQMASAVDERLLGSLRELFARLQIRLKSIQPHLMLAINACENSLRKRSAWLALIEHGNLCLALLQEGRWSWVRAMRLGVQWHEELPLLLERESFNANLGARISDVLLWAPEHDAAAFTSDERWNVGQLQPALVPGFSSELNSRFALYMSEECR